MCFQEFVGYTCGHCSIAVLRPCPMTTAHHMNPVCEKIASKPLLLGQMCPACQRIVHSRATLIEEYEHRFMHERGVCGCEVNFPYLIRPRLVGRDNPELKGKEKARAQGQIPPLIVESYNSSGKLQVSVRQPSLYAAEWIEDHRKRHESGDCRCRGDFRTYQEVLAAMETSEGNRVSQSTTANVSSSQATGRARAEHDNDARDGISSGSATVRPSTSQPQTERPNVLGSPPPGDPHGYMAGVPACYMPPVPTSYAEFYTQGQYPPPPGGGPNTTTTNQSTSASSQPVQPARYAGGVYSQMPSYLGLTGPYMVSPSPYAQSLGCPALADMQTFDYKPTGIPVVGFPMGAGPETVPHAGAWENCSLNPSASRSI